MHRVMVMLGLALETTRVESVMLDYGRDESERTVQCEMELVLGYCA